MTEPNETELKRRDVLKRGAVATGTLIVGGTAVSGNVTAHNAKGVGYIRGVKEGDSVTLVEDLRPEQVELGCEGKNGRHRVLTADTDNGFNINILNASTEPGNGDALDIVKVVLTCQQNQNGKPDLKKVQFEVRH